MRVFKKLILAVALLVVTGFISKVQAQYRPITSDEYLRSVSRQAKERSWQGQTQSGVQTVADIASLPTLRQTTQVETAGFTPRNPGTFQNSPTGLPSPPATRFQEAAPTATPTATSATTRYPYPAQTRPRVAPTNQVNPGFATDRTFANTAPGFRATNATSGNPAYGTNAVFGSGVVSGANSSLGTNSTTVVTPPPSTMTSNYAVPNSVLSGNPNQIVSPQNYPATNYPATNYPAPNYAPAINPPTNFAPPTVSTYSHNVNPAYTLGHGPAVSANPGIANQPTTITGNPVVTNFLPPTQIAPQPVYSPNGQVAVPGQLQNMPPGSYQGTGLDGRPVTYTDGQPVRNLFRYIFP